MKPSFTLIGLACAALALCAGNATAQWKWKDSRGNIQFSDRPPPPDTPEQNILKRPSTVRAMPSVEPAAGAAPGVATNDKVTTDPELEAKRKKLEKDQADKAKAAQKAEADRVAAIKADNCRRAQSNLKALEEGMRIARVNDKGEREILDDTARASEISRNRALVTSECQR
jgi:hypothetical protein